ncbi:MAG: sugar phosphate isomerase/epimerase [Deltaproteobacteria bacterium]|nr:MAG: sugar phosphate isomerase/epimerase [Deltaproteobacteria bacterium]
MQGRLSPVVGGSIQAFPWDHWRSEFSVAQKHGFKLMEWTLDQEKLYENPLLTSSGQEEIKSLCKSHDVSIPSLTGDCFMQAPFWKASGAERPSLKEDFIAVVQACARVGISLIVVPLVDKGRIESSEQEDVLVGFLKGQESLFASRNIRIVFESDFDPSELTRFIKRFDPALFGINYDIGNSSALGFSPEEEFRYYGNRIMNVHVKDRPLHGTTVPLGAGHADFRAVFSALKGVHYKGNYILQTARADSEAHAEVLCRYRDMTLNWLDTYGT